MPSNQILRYQNPKMSGEGYATLEQLLADLEDNDPTNSLHFSLRTRTVRALPDLSGTVPLAVTNKFKSTRKTSIYELFGSDSEEDEAVTYCSHDAASSTAKSPAEQTRSVSHTSAEATESEISIYSFVRAQTTQLATSSGREVSWNGSTGDASGSDSDDEDERNSFNSETSSKDTDSTMAQRNDTYKRRIFPTEPMCDKPVTEVAGIGKVVGDKLAKDGFPLARDLFKQLTTHNFDEGLFKTWLRDEYHVTLKNAKNCYDCLCEWYHQFSEDYPNGNIENDEDNSRKKLRSRTTGRLSSAVPAKRKAAPVNESAINGDSLQESEKSDETMSFYITMARKAKKFPELLRKEVEMEVYGIVSKAELKRAQEEAAAPRPSTSRDNFEFPAPPGPA